MTRKGANHVEWDEEGWLSWARRVDSPNFGARPPDATVSLVVIHNISLPPGEFGGDAVERFFTNRLDSNGHPYFAHIAGIQVSAHFFLRRDGSLLQFVSADHRAWHAGVSAWRGCSNCNDYSVGIELEGTDDRPYEKFQYEKLSALLAELCRRYPIREVVGHSHVAPGRKTDPGVSFDWGFLRTRFPHLFFPES